VEALVSGQRCDTTRFRALLGETAPENLTGELKRFAPSRLVIADSADFGKTPGGLVLADSSEITGISFSTHRLPLFVLTDYLESQFPCDILILGIQPGTLGLFAPVSAPVRAAIRDAAEVLARAVVAGLSAPSTA
jgi:hydrogenase 3 maturation protease